MIYKYTILSPDEILSELITKTKLNSSNTLTKFTKNSVARGLLFAVASSISYAKGYIDVSNARKFLSSCTGEALDNYAKEYYGISRHQQTKSSAELFVIADAGTVYPAGTTFVSTSGVRFITLEDRALASGCAYGFIPVESLDAGSHSKVYSYTITSCQNPPDGHQSCTNFIPSYGGYDEESDDEFRTRLFSLPQKVSQETPAKIEAITYELFPTVGKCFCTATSHGFAYLAVLKSSGAEFTQLELDEIKAGIQSYLSFANSINLKVANINKLFIDFKVDITIKPSADFDDVFKEVQAVLLAFFEPRFYMSSSIRGELVLSELTKISDIIDVDQSSFSLSSDVVTPKTILPWLRTINMTMTKESGDSKIYTQTIPEELYSSFNPNVKDTFEDVL